MVSANSLLEQYNLFFYICAKCDPYEISKTINRDDIAILEFLFIKGIKTSFIFEIIALYDILIAEKLLIKYYLGVGVSPDTKGRGFEFEISSFLADYNDIQGEEKLRNFLIGDSISYKNLTDKRVIRSLSEIFDESQKNILKWIKINKQPA